MRPPPSPSPIRTEPRWTRVVSACIDAAGRPAFALSTLPATAAVDYDWIEEQLRQRGYECPFVHFDESEAPPFLIPAVERYFQI